MADSLLDLVVQPADEQGDGRTQNHPIPNTNDAYSCQIILPAKQLGRRTDVYIFCVSYAHHTAAPGRCVHTHGIPCFDFLVRAYERRQRNIHHRVDTLGLPVKKKGVWTCTCVPRPPRRTAAATTVGSPHD